MMKEQEEVKILVKVLATKEDLLLILPVEHTIAQVKQHIEENHSNKPSAKHQRIVYKGHILADDLSLIELISVNLLIDMD